MFPSSKNAVLKLNYPWKSPRPTLTITIPLNWHPSNGGYNSTTAIYSTAHRRTFSESENLNNITEIQEQPLPPRSLGSIGTLPTAVGSGSFLHGKGKAMLTGLSSAAGTAAGGSLLRPAADGERVVYARTRRNYTWRGWCRRTGKGRSLL